MSKRLFNGFRDSLFPILKKPGYSSESPAMFLHTLAFVSYDSELKISLRICCFRLIDHGTNSFAQGLLTFLRKVYLSHRRRLLTKNSKAY